MSDLLPLADLLEEAVADLAVSPAPRVTFELALEDLLALGRMLGPPLPELALGRLFHAGVDRLGYHVAIEAASAALLADAWERRKRPVQPRKHTA